MRAEEVVAEEVVAEEVVAAEVVEGYLGVALGLDRLIPGSADLYGLRPALPARRAPADLVRAAGTLAAALPGDLDPARARFLRGQLLACEWTARRLAGQAVPFVDEVAAAFGVRIVLGSQDRYRAAHRELAALLPWPGSPAERLAAYRRSDVIPPGLLGPAARAMADALRERTRRCVALPPGESVRLRIVDDAPWTALHHYEGGFASRVVLNAGAGIRRAQLAPLLAHETYPGHHTERCRKEAGLVAGGAAEHRLVLANSPQALMAEGAAELGLRAVVGPGWGRWAADVLAGVGLPFDGELAERVDEVMSVLAPVRQDAALLLHGRRAPIETVVTHIRHWMLVDEARAVAIVRFLRHPLWRVYATAYVEGAPLLRRWWERGSDPVDRFRRLLDEPLTPGAVRVEMAAAVPPDGRSPFVHG